MCFKICDFIFFADMCCRYQMVETISALFDKKEWSKEQVQEE
jgi:hypothetical protein